MCAFYANFVNCYGIFAYYAAIMLNAFLSNYAQNCAGIVGSSLVAIYLKH